MVAAADSRQGPTVTEPTEDRKSAWIPGAVTWSAAGPAPAVTEREVARLIPAPDPDDEQQIEALEKVMAEHYYHGHRHLAVAALRFLSEGGRRG